MIETRAAHAALDDILGVDGIDGVFVGPSDFSIALSDGAQVDATNETMLKAAGEVAAKARKAGKFPARSRSSRRRRRAIASWAFASSRSARFRLSRRRRGGAAGGRESLIGGSGLGLAAGRSRRRRRFLRGGTVAAGR